MLKIIVAHDPNRIIGNGPKIPWYISEDFKHFKKMTLNHTLIMGSTTFTSIGKPLPGRKTIVLNFDNNFDAMGGEVITDYMELVNRYKNSEEVVYICGGASIYRLFLPYCDELIVSKVKNVYEGNIYFPPYEEEFTLKSVDPREEFDICIYRRKVND